MGAQELPEKHNNYVKSLDGIVYSEEKRMRMQKNGQDCRGDVMENGVRQN